MNPVIGPVILLYYPFQLTKFLWAISGGKTIMIFYNLALANCFNWSVQHADLHSVGRWLPDVMMAVAFSFQTMAEEFSSPVGYFCVNLIIILAEHRI